MNQDLKTALTRVCYGMLGMLLALVLAVPGWAATDSVASPFVEGTPALDLGPTQANREQPVLDYALDDRQDLEAFVDSIFNQETEAGEVPGGAIAIVKGGDILFSKGYGYADLDSQTPVDAETTLFRVASISKLFTITAVMQLQEQEALKLDDPIAPYLGDAVQLQNPFPEPVTFAQLMTHTEGLTKRRIGLAADTEARMQALEEYLAENLPPIVYPPGELFSYSSHAIALLGYLVQQISGQPFVEYIADNILQPLDMERASFAQPPPYQTDLATGYQKAGGQFQPVPFLYLNIGPGAAMSSTATDMAHFMIAQLRGGEYQGDRILQPESVEELHTIHFRPHPELPGTGYGFRERRINGIDTVGHLGSLRGYSSSLTLLPDRDVGIFVVSNSFSGIHSRFLRQFFDRYFPPEPDSPAASDQAQALSDENRIDLDRFVGTYRDLEYSHHTITKLSAPYQRIHIQRTDRGLQIQTPSLLFRSSRSPSQLVPVGPLLFRQDDGTLTAFEADSEGNILYAYNPVFAKMATFAKIAWYEDIWLHLGILGVAVLLFISGVWIWPIHPILRRLRGKSFMGDIPTSLAWEVAGLTSAFNLIFLIGFPLSLYLYGAWKLAYGMPWFGYGFLVLPIASALLTLGMIGFAVWSWRQNWSAVRRWHYGLLTLAAVLVIALTIYWNILGFQF